MRLDFSASIADKAFNLSFLHLNIRASIFVEEE